MTGVEYLTNRRSMSQPGRQKAARLSGMVLLRSAQTVQTRNSAMRAQSVATAAPSIPSMGKPDLPKISR